MDIPFLTNKELELFNRINNKLDHIGLHFDEYIGHHGRFFLLRENKSGTIVRKFTDHEFKKIMDNIREFKGILIDEIN